MDVISLAVRANIPEQEVHKLQVVFLVQLVIVLVDQLKMDHLV